jgi:hypothetical protein
LRQEGARITVRAQLDVHAADLRNLLVGKVRHRPFGLADAGVAAVRRNTHDRVLTRERDSVSERLVPAKVTFHECIVHDCDRRRAGIVSVGEITTEE